jgi:hypothetical protein
MNGLKAGVIMISVDQEKKFFARNVIALESETQTQAKSIGQQHRDPSHDR